MRICLSFYWGVVVQTGAWLICLIMLVMPLSLPADELFELPVHWKNTLQPIPEPDLSGTEPAVSKAITQTRQRLAELLVNDATEVANSWNRDTNQAVKKLPHPLSTQRDATTNRDTGSQLEVRDRLLGPSHDRLLTSDLG